MIRLAALALVALAPQPAATPFVQDGATTAAGVSVLTPSAAIEDAIQAEFERQGLIGLAVAVFEGDEITEYHFGMADRGNDVPVGAETMFRWASISKPVTAVRAMQLVQDERLDLDADVRTLVPEFPEKPWPVTSRQLMGHLGGVVHYRNGEVIRTDREYDVEHPFEDSVLALDRFKESPLVAEPGTKYAYTTHGYMLLGAVVQRAGDSSYWSQVKEHVAKPLGMTTFRPDYQWEEIPNRAVGYRKIGNRVFPSTNTDVSWKLPGGGYISTVGDLARFAQGLCGEKVLPRAAFDEMWTRQKTAGGKQTAYGLGFGIQDRDGKLGVGHGGSQEKTRTFLQVLPDEGRGVVVMTNSKYANTREICDAVWAALD